MIYVLSARKRKFVWCRLMKKSDNLNDTLEYIKTYSNALSFIDRKIPLLEHSDSDLRTENRRLNKLKNKFKGANLLFAWLVCTAICLIPMSVLNMMIETELNLLFLTPVFSAIVLYLYKTKYEKNTQQPQIKAMSNNLSRLETENKEIIGEINYAKRMADEALTMLLLDESKQSYDISECDLKYTNLAAVTYAYGYTGKQPITPKFNDVISRFQTIVDNIKQDNKSPDLLEEYKTNALTAEYRRGAIKRCAKVID